MVMEFMNINNLNDMKKIKISILSPAHQAEKYIVEFVESLWRWLVLPLKKKNITYEIIIAEDGSTDKTRKILIRLAKKYKLKLVLSSKKLGYIKAAKNLFKMAKGDLIFFLDADGEINPKSFWKLYDLWNKDDFDIVTGYKLNRKPFHRLIISKINNFVLRLLFNTNVKDANAGFKLYKSKVGKKIISESGYLKYNFNSEQIIRAIQHGYNIGQVGVQHFERESISFPPGKLIKVTLIAFLELVKFRFFLKNKVINL